MSTLCQRDLIFVFIVSPLVGASGIILWRDP
jgi:hypothetical protein